MTKSLTRFIGQSFNLTLVKFKYVIWYFSTKYFECENLVQQFYLGVSYIDWTKSPSHRSQSRKTGFRSTPHRLGNVKMKINCSNLQSIVCSLKPSHTSRHSSFFSIWFNNLIWQFDMQMQIICAYFPKKSKYVPI